MVKSSALRRVHQPRAEKAPVGGVQIDAETAAPIVDARQGFRLHGDLELAMLGAADRVLEGLHPSPSTDWSDLRVAFRLLTWCLR